MSETSEAQLALIALEGLRREYGLTMQLRRDGAEPADAKASIQSAPATLDALWDDVRQRHGMAPSVEWDMPSPVTRMIAKPVRLQRAGRGWIAGLAAAERAAGVRVAREAPDSGEGDGSPVPARGPRGAGERGGSGSTAGAPLAAGSAIDPEAARPARPASCQPPSESRRDAAAGVWTARAIAAHGDESWAASAPSAYEAVCRLAERLDESIVP
ncbi:MAG: hypothetical protein AB8G96_01210 [Phycisphaerales bacterium]